MPSSTALSMHSMEYAPRVFSVSDASSRLSVRACGSITTFSSTVPNRRVVA